MQWETVRVPRFSEFMPRSVLDFSAGYDKEISLATVLEYNYRCQTPIARCTEIVEKYMS